ncbi:metallophosphoesterase [Jiangella gansuensis]|uniref:metallophosphoesterase n=1 Tax=Jiangella gansuensis TaxID=281473 RepID=UPI0004B22C65|nr:metallophosphoesterase [Jiangella gansuensis]
MVVKQVALGAAVAAAAGLAYAAGYEVRSYRLRRFDVPVLAPGSRPLRVLHVSDLHLIPGQRSKAAWVRRLAALEPDLVVNTGDNLAHPDAVPAVLDALGPLLALPGVFVFGSNDYYRPQPKNPARYLRSLDDILDENARDQAGAVDLPWKELRDELRSGGWLDLNNAHGSLTVDGRRIAFAGVDDPHLGRDRLEDIAGPADSSADLTVGVSHAPYLRVLDHFRAYGYRLLLAGHTHGGQLCVPGFGALVTNCDLDRKRVKGVSRHPAVGGADAAWLHVSAGLGTSPYAPVRFACPPEATLLTLTGSR